jgi:hypothetical protein
MLESDELNCISAFARVVDCSPQIRAEIANASTIEDVVSIAHLFGHCKISTKLLVKAAEVLRSSEWVWEESGSRWNNFFSLALAMITESIPVKYQDLRCPNNSKPIFYNDFEAQEFINAP